jgi:regulator of protease activity HflC (stomatin/prohibitin superfamily)
MKLNKKLKILITAIVVVTIVLSVIFMLSQGQRVEVSNFVRAYNTLISKAHLELNAGLMRSMTSDWQLKKIDSYIASNLKQGRTIKGGLIELNFKDVKVENDLATVITIERWLWSYVDPATKKPVSEIFDEWYGVTYHLKMTQSRWVVDDIVNEFIGKAVE